MTVTENVGTTDPVEIRNRSIPETNDSVAAVNDSKNTSKCSIVVAITTDNWWSQEGFNVIDLVSQLFLTIVNAVTTWWTDDCGPSSNSQIFHNYIGCADKRRLHVCRTTRFDVGVKRSCCSKTEKEEEELESVSSSEDQAMIMDIVRVSRILYTGHSIY